MTSLRASSGANSDLLADRVDSLDEEPVAHRQALRPAAPERPRMDDAFWLRYLRAHADPRTRTLHFAGTAVATTVLLTALARRDRRLAGLALVCGYGPAWFSHARIERNKPETFSAPLRSLAADYRTPCSALTGKPDVEIARAETAAGAPAAG